MNKCLYIFKLLTLTLLLSGCSGLFPQATAKEIIILAADQESYCETKFDKKISIDVSEGNSPEYLRNQKVLFKNQSALGNYQYAEWSEPLNDRVLRLITEKLRCQGFSIDDLNYDQDFRKYNLVLSILDFSHFTAPSPGKFKAIFRISLSDEQQQRERLFNYEENLESFDIQGVSKAADAIVNKFLR